MPELPEIESLKLTLEPQIKGKKIDKVIVKRHTLRFRLPQGFARKLGGRAVERLSRRAKYLLVELEGEIVLLVHLGMTGRLVFYPTKGLEEPCPKKHDHVIFHFAHGVLIFNDTRRFGFMDIVPKDRLKTHPRLKDLGPEPLDPSWRAKELAQSLKGRKTSIKAILFNQKLIAGLGNIYICEALFAAGIDPKKIAQSLDDKECQKLHRAIVRQIRRAIAAGGSTISDYLDGKGKKGSFQHQFKVYGKEGQPCPKTKCSGTIARITQNMRSTFYCAQCQK